MSEANDSREGSLQNMDEEEQDVEEEGSNGPKPHQARDLANEVFHTVESKEDMFVDATDDMQETQFQESAPSSPRGAIEKEYKDERDTLKKEVARLRTELKLLIGDIDNDSEVFKGDVSFRDMLSECSRFVNIALEEREKSEGTIRELRQEVLDLNGKVSQLDEGFGGVLDRMLGSLGMVVNLGELADYSVMGKMDYVERSASLLVEQYRWFLYEIDQLRQFLFEGGFNVQEEVEYGSVFGVARGELMELKRKEGEMVKKLGYLEEENRKLAEEIEKVKTLAEAANAELETARSDLEQERNRCANTKEKLSMAVTKGKALVQQRDLLNQSLAEKTNELEKCLAELQEKSSAVEAAELCKGELIKYESLVASLQGTVSQRNAILESFEEIFSQANVPGDLQSLDVVERLKWLVNKVRSLQELLLQKDVAFENFEKIVSQITIPEDLKSMDIIERLKSLVNLVASLQEALSQRNRSLNNLEEVFSLVNAPADLQSMDTVERLKWLMEERNALKGTLLEFKKLKDALSLIDLPETASSSDLEARIGCLRDSFNRAKVEINILQDEIARSKEAAQSDTDHLTAALLAELQEKEYIKMELDELAHQYERTVERAHQALFEKNQMVRMLLEVSGITVDSLKDNDQGYSNMAMLTDRCFGKIKERVNKNFDDSFDAEMFARMQGLLYVRDQELMLCENLLEEDMRVRSEVDNLSNDLTVAFVELAALKEEKESMLRDLEQSEEKSALLREKLSLAVKKGKGLVKDRENLKLLLDEKNSEIAKLKLELQQQESAVSECMNKINKLYTDLEQIPKLEADLLATTEQRDHFQQFLLDSNNMLQKIIEPLDNIVRPVHSAVEEPVEKVKWIAEYINECQQAKSHAEQELGKVREEARVLASELAEAQQTMKSLGDDLKVAEKNMLQLSEEKREMEIAKKNAELDLQNAIDETAAQTSNFTEACRVRKSLEDALLLAENNVSLHIKEREEAQLSGAATETELEKVREKAAIQSSKLTEAYGAVKSLEDALSHAESNVSLLAEENTHIQVERTNLQNELKKLQDEAESQAGKLADASTTIKSLEDSLSKAVNDISVLQAEKRTAELEIFTLNSKLDACMNELSGANGHLESRSVELMHHLSNLQMLAKSDSLLSMVRLHFEKQFANLKNMDLILKDIRHHFVEKDSQVLQSLPLMQVDEYATKPFPDDLGRMENTEMHNGELNAADVDDISLYFKKTVDGFQLRDKLFGDNFEGLSIFMDEYIEALLRKLRATRDMVIIIVENVQSVEQKVKNTEMNKEDNDRTIAALENDVRVLLSACTNATRELQFEVKNSFLELSSIPELEKFNHGLIPETVEVGGADDTEHLSWLDDSKYANIVQNLLSATKKIRTLTKLFESTSSVAGAKIEDLQNELREARAASVKAIEERDLIQNKALELETIVGALQNSCQECRLKVADYQVIEEKLKEKEAEVSTLHGNLSMKEQEREDSLMSASQLRTLVAKARQVEISFTESDIGDLEPHSSADVKKLFDIVDRVTDLHSEINELSRDKDELQSSLSTKILEIEHLKKEIKAHLEDKQDSEKMKSEMSELMFSLEKVISLLGGNAILGDQKFSTVHLLLQALEKRIMALLMEGEKSKSHAQELDTKLLASQQVIDELSTKIKLFEDSSQSRTPQPEIVQERSIFEAPSQRTDSEISEIEDVGSLGKNTFSPVPSAAHVRTMRKGSSEYLAVDADLESGSLVNSGETDEEKGHVFKSLNTSGLIPRQGKSLADRVDGIWVSGGRVLMSRPRARLGLIAYWLVLHVWLLGTFL